MSRQTITTINKKKGIKYDIFINRINSKYTCEVSHRLKMKIKCHLYIISPIDISNKLNNK